MAPSAASRNLLPNTSTVSATRRSIARSCSGAQRVFPLAPEEGSGAAPAADRHYTRRLTRTMPAPMYAFRAQRLRELFLELHAIMSAEHETNWIRGVGNIIAILGEADDDPSAARERIDEAHRSYRSMHAGNGSFSDFHIWRESFDERVRANAELTRVTEAIWREFESTS
jgi:hypothetical protein